MPRSLGDQDPRKFENSHDLCLFAISITKGKTMDTAAYLTNQGWRGDGHALHHSGRGITKPIRVSQKLDVYGLGKKKHDAHADQWWARAFDATLKGINSTKDGVTGKTEGISEGAPAQATQIVGVGGAKWVGQRGLYSNFVRGECLGGTLTPPEEQKPDGIERNENGIDRVDEPQPRASTEKRKGSKRRQQGKNTNVNSPVMVYQAAVQTTSLEPTPTVIVGQETKEERRQRRKERQARRALDNGAMRHVLPAQTEAKLDECLKIGRSKRPKIVKPCPSTGMDSAVSEDVTSGLESRSTKKRRRMVVDDGSG